MFAESAIRTHRTGAGMLKLLLSGGECDAVSARSVHRGGDALPVLRKRRNMAISSVACTSFKRGVVGHAEQEIV